MKATFSAWSGDGLGVNNPRMTHELLHCRESPLQRFWQPKTGLFIWVCAYVWWACIHECHMYMGIPVCMNAHMQLWKPSGVSFGCSPSYNWGRVFHLKPEFADTYSLACQFTPGIPVSASQVPGTYVRLEIQTSSLHLCSKHFTHWAISLALALPWFYITSFRPNSLSFITRLWAATMLIS